MQFLRNKIIQPLAEMPPFQKFMVLTVGTLGGIVPIPAITSAVTVGLGAVTKLNPQGIAVATAWNLILTPMQFVCFVPFAQLGKVLLATFFGLLLSLDPATHHNNAASIGKGANGGSGGNIPHSGLPADADAANTASADSGMWGTLRALSTTVENTHPSLSAIKNAEGFSDLIATSGGMLAIATFAWTLVTIATLGGSYAIVRPLLGRSKGASQKAAAATTTTK